MTSHLAITAACIVDPEGLRTSAGRRITWREHDLDPGAGVIRWQHLFAAAYSAFRRLDLTTRMFAIAAEALDLDRRIDAGELATTAQVLATSTGCLTADLRFEAGLQQAAGIEPAVFPYTLPSTCLGEIAIRHGLRGPTLCLSVPPGGEWEGLATATELIEAQESSNAVVLLGDWSPGTRSLPGKTNIAALLLQPDHTDTPALAHLDRGTIGILPAISRALGMESYPVDESTP
jgi:hypothetical protein